MERENLKLIKETRRAERDRKRLEMGDDFQSDEEEKLLDEPEEESESESDSYYDSQEHSSGEDRDSMASQGSLRPTVGRLAGEQNQG